MTWSRQDILTAYMKGESLGASHMIVAYDDFDHENYPIYVMPGENPADHKPENGDRVDEVYRFSLGWSAQQSEFRAKHWEWDDPTQTAEEGVEVTGEDPTP